VGAVSVVLCRFGVSEAVVVRAAGLMREMLQTVPLRARLSIDVDLVIHCLPVREVREVDLLLVKLLAAEARELNIV
jgi:hypothetical protein